MTRSWFGRAVRAGVLVGCGLVATAVQAQEGADAVFAKPSPQHAVLKQEVGVWDATMKLFMGGPDAPSTETKGVETTRMLEGGLWVVSEFNGQLFGRNFQGRSSMGFDPEKGKYVATWVDNASPKIMMMEGTYDEATRRLTMFTDSKDPATGKAVREKHVTEFPDDDTRIFRMSQPGEGGKEVLLMEVTYKRRKS